MGTISEALAKTVIDKIAKIYSLLDPALGDCSAVTMSSEHGQDNRNSIRDCEDEEVILDLLQDFEDTLDLLKTANTGHVLLRKALVGLERHSGGMNAWRTSGAYTWRFPQEYALLCRKLQIYLAPLAVFPVPFGDGIELGTYAVSGSGAGVFSPGSSVDTLLYGPYGDPVGGGQTDSLELEVIGQTVGGSDIIVTPTYVDQDSGTPEACSAPATIPSSSGVGTKVDVTLNGADWGAFQVTAISITGGTAGDDFRIQGKRERVLPS